MNIARNFSNYRDMSPENAAGAYAADLALQELAAEQEEARIDDEAAKIRAAIACGDGYNGHSLLSVVVNSEDGVIDWIETWLRSLAEWEHPPIFLRGLRDKLLAELDRQSDLIARGLL